MKTFRFRPPDGGQIPFDYLPGQFLTLHIAPQCIPTKRSYTIASTPTWRDRIEITVKREDHGLVSRWLPDDLKIGSEVEIEAPNGTFFFTGKQADSIVLIGRRRGYHTHDERGALSHRDDLARKGPPDPRLPGTARSSSERKWQRWRRATRFSASLSP